MKGKIYIGGLVKSVRKPEVERAFGRFGKLKEVWLAHNPPGFAFVHYVFPEDANDAIRAMDGKRLSGAKIRVESAKSLGRKAPSSSSSSSSRPPPSRAARRPLPPPPRPRERPRLQAPLTRRPYTPPPRSLSPPSPRRRLAPLPRGRSPLPLLPPLPPLRRRSPLPISRGRSPSPLPLRRKGRPPSPPGSWSPPPPLRDTSYSRSDLPRYRDERSQYTADRVPYISFDRRRMNRSPLPPPPPPLPPPVRYRSRSPIPRRRYKWG